MTDYLTITDVKGREILDSRGNPTVEVEVVLEDGAEGYRVSGAALLSGILLQPLFRGTGYDKNQRTQGDYGSNLYIIEEV